ncbi:probable carbohydrate esterase at4g34215 [Phtheirospermum japonicum]|uniref:Probable carbohydrate esterase at4g34215 n=1 Tax=Phtheirospermum japonicum TaxID=374723 RepID=A0A830CAJ7_9LAMI|nr:probable carbohydrate esterase at4g34215 [Phtheirospermum japonicum]
MSGRGGVHNKHKQWDGVVPLDSAADPSRIFRLGPHLYWEAAREPLHQGIDANRSCGVGPGMSFANGIKESVGVVGLVPCAVAGTAVKDWARGTAAYDSMVRRAKAAGGEVKALLWYQGEKDTFTEEDANVYKESSERFIVGVRQDLGLPSLPVILVAIASGRGYLEKVRHAQKEINLPNVVCVDAMGLPLQEDNLHLTTEAQVELGRMLADAYLTHFLG